MLKSFFEKIFTLFSYQITGKNNQIFILENGVKKPLRRKIKGLKITIIGSNNYVEIENPIKFNNTRIKIAGSFSKFTIKKTNTIVDDMFFYLESYSEIFIDEDSRFNMRRGEMLVGNNENEKPHKLVIGKSVQLGTCAYIRTSDGHSIFIDGEDLPYNEPEDVIIGDNVWIGAKCTILKGSEIPSNTIVGACSVVNKKFTESGTIIAGNPAKIIKKGVSWKRMPYGRFMNRNARLQALNKNNAV